ncbi:MAG: 4Fe-4S binding protein [Deltaproteobacteria bacterium]|nr:4Fe-4S binding protein [Deltaproteobacteria bacterium]
MLLLHSVLLLVLFVGLGAVVYQDMPALQALNAGWAFVMVGLYRCMREQGKPGRWRAIFFMLLAFLFLPVMHGRPLAEPLPYCHIGMSGTLLQTLYGQVLAGLHGSWFKFGVLGLGAGWLLVLLAQGPGFCSWTCFFGGWDDFFSRILKKPPVRLPASSRPREFQLALFVFVLLISFAAVEPVFCQWLCPFKLTDAIIPVHARSAMLQKCLYAAIGLGAVILLPLFTGKRVFCSMLCPFGALPPLFSRIVPYAVAIDDSACTGCGICVRVCPSFAVEQPGGRVRINRYCTLCGRCLDACPEQAISLSLFRRRRSRLLLFVSVALSGALSVFYVPRGLWVVVERLKGVLL